METISHFDMLKTMSIPNNFLGRKNSTQGIHLSMGNINLKNKYVTSTNYLSWTDENGLSYTLMNDPSIRKVLESQGIEEVYGSRRHDAECFDKCGNITFDEAIQEPYSVMGSGLLYRNLAGFMQYCVSAEKDYSESEEEQLDPFTEVEKMYAIFMSPEIMKASEENVEGYDANITGLDLAEENREFLKTMEFSETQEDCQ